MNEHEEEEGEAPNAFLVTLGQIRHGEAAAEASRRLDECLCAVRETGKKGKVTVELDIKPMSQDGDQIMIKVSSKAAIPLPEVPAAVFFLDEDNGLHTSDPNQSEFEFRRAKEKPVRKASGE